MNLWPICFKYKSLINLKKISITCNGQFYITYNCNCVCLITIKLHDYIYGLNVISTIDIFLETCCPSEINIFYPY